MIFITSQNKNTMAKDPAFLFYPNDYLGGTMGMTFEQKGAYIELLMMQFNHGKFTEAQAKQVLSICSASVWQVVKQKFRTDGEYFWNQRLEDEIVKRKKFSESRRINALGGSKKKKKDEASAKHMHQHMENENENRNIDGVIDYLNTKTEKNFKTVDANRKNIRARLNDGFTIDDCKKVIDIKCAEWNNTEYSKYLNPETLFRPSKFEKYLNQEPVKSNYGRMVG